MRRLLATFAVLSSALAAQQLVPPPGSDNDSLFYPPLDPLSAAPAPVALRVGEAQYPEEAKIAGLEGTVIISAAPAANGALQDIKIERSLGLGLDERAIQAIATANTDARLAAAQSRTFAIDFNLPEKRSRWHLAGIEFQPPQGVSRPTFLSANYPPGADISVAAFDEGRILGAIGRAATATVSFDIDESGFPGHFLILDASAEVWGPEAVMLLRTWRFHPGNRGGIALTVPCTVKLLWGPTDFASSAIERQLSVMFPGNSPQPVLSPVNQSIAAPRPAR